jgi:integrase
MNLSAHSLSGRRPRPRPYRARIEHKDWNAGKPVIKMFQKEAEARRWIREQEAKFDSSGMLPTFKDLQRRTVEELFQTYMNETPDLGESERSYFNAFLAARKKDNPNLLEPLRRDICGMSLAAFDDLQAENYKNFWLKATWKGTQITPAAVHREINAIQPAWKWARKHWRLKNLENPFRDIEIKQSDVARDRRLEPGELDKLTAACKACLGLKRYYMPLAIYLAVETGMRRKEMLTLTWEDVDIDRRIIKIRNSKTGKPRLIVLTIMAAFALLRLHVALLYQHRANLDRELPAGVRPEQLSNPDLKADIETIQAGYAAEEKELKGRYYWTKGYNRVWEDFPKTVKEHYRYNQTDRIFFDFSEDGHAFEQVWDDIRRRAGLKHSDRSKRLTWHDLRREAGSRFDEAGLTKGEHDLMMGHANRDMASRYIRAYLKSIQDKLDKYTLGGKTQQELDATMEANCATYGGPLSPEDVAIVKDWYSKINDDDLLSSPITGYTDAEQRAYEQREKTIAQVAAGVNSDPELRKLLSEF